MNYYTFNNFPKLDIKTFYKDSFWFNDTRSQKYINVMLVKLVWGYNESGTQSASLKDTIIWLKR